MADDKLYETLKNSALAHVKAFESPDPFNPERIYGFRAPGCIMHFHPCNSIGAPFDNNNDISWDKHHPGALRMLGALMDSMRGDIKQVVVDTKTRTVVVRFEAYFDFKAVGDEPEEKEYMIEYCWITEHDEAGKKIVGMEEFLDPIRAGYMISKSIKYAELNAK